MQVAGPLIQPEHMAQELWHFKVGMVIGYDKPQEIFKINSEKHGGKGSSVLQLFPSTTYESYTWVLTGSSKGELVKIPLMTRTLGTLSIGKQKIKFLGGTYGIKDKLKFHGGTPKRKETGGWFSWIKNRPKNKKDEDKWIDELEDLPELGYDDSDEKADEFIRRTRLMSLVSQYYPDDLYDTTTIKYKKYWNNYWTFASVDEASGKKPDFIEQGFVFLNDNDNLKKLLEAPEEKIPPFIKEIITRMRDEPSTATSWMVRAPGGQNMFDNMKKMMKKSWYEILRKAPEYEEDEDKDDKGAKAKKKKPKLKDPREREGQLSSSKKDPLRGTRESINTLTGLQTDPSKGFGRRINVAETDPCCAKLKAIIKSYIEHDNEREWEDIEEDVLYEIQQLDCVELEAAMAEDAPIVIAGFAIDHNEIGFLGEYMGDGEIPDEKDPGGRWDRFDRKTGQLAVGNLRTGTLKEWYEFCLYATSSAPSTRPTGAGGNIDTEAQKDFYADLGIMPEEAGTIAADMGRADEALGLAQRSKELDEKLRQIGTAKEGEKSDIAWREMTRQEQNRERYYDYLDEMNAATAAKRGKPAPPKVERHHRDWGEGGKFKRLKDMPLRVPGGPGLIPILWTTQNHAPCNQLKEWMKVNGYQFEEKDAPTSHGSTPTLEVGDRKIDGVAAIKRYLERTGVGKRGTGGTKT